MVTNSFSLNLNLAALVKIPLYRKWNQPVTNSRYFISYLVGTSETTRATSFSHEILFNQWLAGLIDGDGTFQLSKKGYTSCEITVSLEDERMLRIIQNKIGGSIKPRSGVKAIRWRLHNREGMINLVNRVNGYIRHSKRLVQLNNILTVLNIPVLSPDSLHNKHAWFSGFFDADGTIGYYIKGTYANPQLTITVTNKYYVDVLPYLNIFGGAIYFDKSQNGYYKWSIQSKINIISFLDYVKICPFQSIKRNRLFLIKEYFRLIELNAHKAPEASILNKAWIRFNQKWN